MECNPLVSIVIPARNASKYLKQCLDSIKLLDFPQDGLEVIIADNGSTDNTAIIAKDSGAQVVEAGRLRVGGVRNRGAAHAKGRIIAFTDSDILVGKNWISAAVDCLQDEQIGAVGGACHAPDDGTWVEKSWTNCSVSKSIKVNYLAGSSLILRRDLFEKIGGFNEKLVAAEDDDLSQRITNIKLQLIHVPNCDVIHLGYPQTLFDVARRQVWLGSSIAIRNSNLSDPMTFMTFIFILTSASFFPLLLFGLKYVAIIDILLTSTIPMVVAGKKTIRGSDHYGRFLHFFLLWLVYVSYFIGKGIGIIKGLFREK